MHTRRLTYLLLLLLLPLMVHSQERNKDGTRIYPDSAIYQGINLKLDFGNSALEAILSSGKRLSFEIATNVRLKQRYYPTLELGYARGQAQNDETTYQGQGGFLRAGVDINGLKKHPEMLNALLVGARIGTALQSYSQADFTNRFGADCWGEVLAGIQVQVWEGLQMGWYIRMKILFTRTNGDKPVPYYIPGFGLRDDTNWGFNYYIGYKL